MKEASGLFQTYGIKSVTMDDIASKLAISKKTIYQFFKDKDEIVTTCSKYLMEEQEREIHRIMGENADAIVQMLEISNYMKQRVRTMSPTLLYDLERYHPSAWACFQHHKHNCMAGELISIMKTGIAQGYFRKDIEVEILAKMRIEQVEMAFNQHIFPAHSFELSTVHIQFLDHFIRGLCTLKGLQHIEDYKKEDKTII